MIDTGSDRTGHSAQIDLYETENKKMKRNTTILNIASIVIIISYTGADFISATSPCFRHISSDEEMGFIITEIVFLFLGLAFFVCGLT